MTTSHGVGCNIHEDINVFLLEEAIFRDSGPVHQWPINYLLHSLTDIYIKTQYSDKISWPIKKKIKKLPKKKKKEKKTDKNKKDIKGTSKATHELARYVFFIKRA